MKKTQAIILSLSVLVFMFGFTPITHANPSAYATTAQTASATTTPVFLTPGVATSTLIYDSYAARPTSANAVNMLVQFTGSSTTSTLNTAYEFSNGGPGLDCLNSPLVCDWYKDNEMTSVNATTSQPFNISQANSYSWAFASSSQGGLAVLATNNRSLKVLVVPVPARYTRVIFSLTVGGTNGAVWAQFIPTKENSN